MTNNVCYNLNMGCCNLNRHDKGELQLSNQDQFSPMQESPKFNHFKEDVPAEKSLETPKFGFSFQLPFID